MGWGCVHRGIDDKHSFAFKSVKACADGARRSAFCTIGQFNHHRKYNGQCKGVIIDKCSGVKGLRGYNTYQINPWVAKSAPTLTQPTVTNTTTTMCVARSVDDCDICNHKTFVDDGSAWMITHEECAGDRRVLRGRYGSRIFLFWPSREACFCLLLS